MKAQMNPHKRLSSKATFFLVGLLPLLLLLLLTTFLKSSSGEVGTAASYGSPFPPTACYGNDTTQFPSNGFLAAAGEEIWDNGTACGRHYWVKCVGGPCAGQVIEVKIVDRAKTSVTRPSQEGSTMVLSETAFKAITTSNYTADFIHIEFFQRRFFINYKWILSIFQKADWKYKLEKTVGLKSWMPEVKDFKFKHGNGTLWFQLKIEVGFFILKVNVTLRDFLN